MSVGNYYRAKKKEEETSSSKVKVIFTNFFKFYLSCLLIQYLPSAPLLTFSDLINNDYVNSIQLQTMWSNILNEICLLLETYKGRDKILRTLCYLTKYLGGIQENELLAKKLFIFSSQMSKTRATLRLLDDFPMIKYSLEYGLGKGEPDTFMAQLGVLTNVIDQVYYPIEKMAWFAEYKLITGIDNDKWDTASSVCWVISIYLTLVKTLRYLIVLNKIQKGSIQLDSVPLDRLLHMQKYEMLSLVRLCFDLTHAINTLPPGFLWSSKLKVWHVGLIGTISSILGIYQVFYKRALK